MTIGRRRARRQAHEVAAKTLDAWLCSGAWAHWGEGDLSDADRLVIEEEVRRLRDRHAALCSMRYINAARGGE